MMMAEPAGGVTAADPVAPTENRRLKIAGLSLIGPALLGLAWLSERVATDAAWWRAESFELAALGLVFIVCANLVAAGLLVLANGFGQREVWRDARARRAVLVKLVGANLLAPAVLLAVLQDDQASASLMNEPWIALPFAALAYTCVALGIGVLRRGQRHEAWSADEAMRLDPREPVVYLRSFRDDGQMPLAKAHRLSPSRLAGRFTTTSAEQELAFILGRIGPVIAIGKPGEPLPELGAARLYVEHQHWQETVLALLRRAALVAVRVGASAGVLWEIEQTLVSVPRERTVFLLLGDGGQVELAARRLRELGVGITLPAPLPLTKLRRFVSLLYTNQRVGAVVSFDRDGTPFVELVRALPRRPAEFLVAMATMRPAGGPLRETFQHVFARWGRPWQDLKSRAVAVGLAFFFGWLGGHWLYIGRPRRALLYLLTFPIAIFVSWFEALKWILMDRRSFDQRVLLTGE